ncbi:MAG: DNA helicase, partial [Alphaproteobacteria bacterium]|nr:DNA helicase [Alphaproteobacteria bacterium]
LAALNAAPPGPGLVRGNDASDLETLTALAGEQEIRDLARGRPRVALLWDACQIPDFRKLADDTHTRFCGRVFRHLATEGGLPTDWLAGQIAGLARADGDIDTLMQRLAGIRTWSYIAARADWVRDAAHWQGRAGEVEDLLSDALHERLLSRFVDRRAAHLMRRLDATEGRDVLSAVTRRGEVVVEGHEVGRVAGFSFFPDPLAEGEGRRLVLRAARRALREEMPRRVAILDTAPDEAFELNASHRIAWEGTPIARLRPGRQPIRPLVEVLDSEFLDGPQREVVRERLQRFVDDLIRDEFAPLFAAVAAADREPALRGPLHRLTEGIGVVPGATEADIPPSVRRRLVRLGVRAGRFALYLPAILKPRPQRLRATLWSLHHGPKLPELPQPGRVSLPAEQVAHWPPGFAESMGWVAGGPVWLRLDMAEREAAAMAAALRRAGAIPLPAGLGSRFGVRAALLPPVLRRLGVRVIPAGSLAADQFGPPAPAMIVPLRRSPAGSPVGGEDARREGGAFAALAVLRRRRGLA